MDNFYCVKGNTWCIDTGATLMAIYRLNEHDIVMIDTGLAYGRPETKCIMHVLDGFQLNVKAIIATHGHLDHIGNNNILAGKYDCKIYMYGSEAYDCMSVESMRIQHTGVAYEEVKDALVKMTSRVDVFITPWEKKINILGADFEIVHTPGHSPSHISIITPDNVMMAGDALMSKDEIVKTKIPYACNFAVDFESKRKIAAMKCDKYIISHRGICDSESIADEVEANIEYLKSRAEIIHGYIEDGMCFDDIAAAVLTLMNIKVANRYYFFDLHGMVKPYVQYLEECGEIQAYYEKGYIRYTVL